MTDTRLRSLERRAVESGGVEDHGAYLRELARIGTDKNTVLVEQARRIGLYEFDYNYVVDDLQVRFSRYDRKREKTSVIFSWNQPDPAWARPPYGTKGENAENDLAWKRYNREELRIQRAQVFRGLRLLGVELPGRTDAKKLPWSKYAGCSSCPCSKGFVPPAIHLRCNEDSDYKRRVDVYVTRLVECPLCKEPGSPDFNSYFPCGHRVLPDEVAVA